MNKVIFSGKVTTNPMTVSDPNYGECIDFLIQRYNITLQIMCRGELAGQALRYTKGTEVIVYGKIGCDAYEGHTGDLYIIADKLEEV